VGMSRRLLNGTLPTVRETANNLHRMLQAIFRTVAIENLSYYLY